LFIIESIFFIFLFKFQKRKFDQYICDGIFTTSFELINREKYGSENSKDHIKDSSSPFSCSTQFDKKQTRLQGIKERVCPTLDDNGEYCEICKEDYSHLSDSEDSIKESSHPMYHGGMKIQPSDFMGSSFSLSTKASLMDNPKMEFVEVSKSLIDENFIDSRTSLSFSSIEEDMKLVVNRFLPSRGNHLPRPIIPIGPRFQAEVPKWEGGNHIKQHYGDDSLKWLGTQIWPIPIISETNIKGSGKRWQK
jgi:hypothetical protein